MNEKASQVQKPTWAWVALRNSCAIERSSLFARLKTESALPVVTEIEPWVGEAARRLQSGPSPNELAADAARGCRSIVGDGFSPRLLHIKREHRGLVLFPIQRELTAVTESAARTLIAHVMRGAGQA